jgi:multicomponent Na+:H+ antiporter subunit A
MVFAVLSGFVLASIIPLLSRYIPKAIPYLIPVLPLALFIYFLGFLGPIGSGEVFLYQYSWVPSFGINLDFQLDGLALLFALMITGIGTLVFFYSASYLHGHPYLDRFYGFLSIFMGAMLGLVLSENLICLFIFWELTSISSFFLIGFNNEDPLSRKSALIALGITGIGGFVLFIGLILLGQAGGSYSFSELLAQTDVLKDHSAYSWIVILLFVGAFTKSAQFPFHFWLPGAMKAPTPVSTYLHSATMVKAGIYLLARFTPMLGETPLWNNTLIIVGGITMLYAAVHSLFRIDLKGILAYSTIAALGLLVFMIGIGTEKALLAAAIFILTHALYKATLFLITGIIDHETGTRDVTRLSGLQKVMLPVAVAGIISAVSSAGFPLLLGFVSKEVFYEATLQSGDWSILLTALAVITKICLLVAGFWAGIKPFTGKLPVAFKDVHLPSPLLWVPPLLLAILSLVFGSFPATVGEALILPVFRSMSGSDTVFYFTLWHGFNMVLLLSGLTLLLGGVLYFVLLPSDQLANKTLRFQPFAPERFVLGFGSLILILARYWTKLFQNGYLRNYIITILAFLSLLMGYRLYDGVDIYVDWSQLSMISATEIIVVVLMISSIFIAILSTSRTTAIVALGIIGFANCLFFLYYSAPDLAMTQFSIDILTVLLFMLVLFNLPRNKTFSSKGIRVRDALLSLFFGSLIAVLALEVLEEGTTKDLSTYFADNAYVLAKGRNVVNVILVDFRGFDTMIETVVLVIAAVGVFSLLKLNLNPDNEG